jgi:hypothetical protein
MSGVIASRVMGPLFSSPALKTKISEGVSNASKTASNYFNRPVETAVSKIGPTGAKLGTGYELLKSLKDYSDVYDAGKKYVEDNPGFTNRLSKITDRLEREQFDDPYYGGIKKKTQRHHRKNKSKKMRKVRRRKTRKHK